MEWAHKEVSDRQRAELAALGLPDLGTYPRNLAAIKFVQQGDTRFVATPEGRRAIFIAGYDRWVGKTVVNANKRSGKVLSIRVRGYYSLFQSGIAPTDSEKIFEVFVLWDGRGAGTGWINVTQLNVLS